MLKKKHLNSCETLGAILSFLATWPTASPRCSVVPQGLIATQYNALNQGLGISLPRQSWGMVGVPWYVLRCYGNPKWPHEPCEPSGDVMRLLWYTNMSKPP